MRQRRKVLTVNNDTALYAIAKLAFVNGIRHEHNLDEIQARYLEGYPDQDITIKMARRDAECTVGFSA